MVSKLNKYYFIPAWSLSFLVILLSLTPLPKLPEIQFIAIDKLLHAAAFTVLMVMYLFGFYKQEQKVYTMKMNAVLSFVICLIIGGGIEILQHYLPIQRYGDWYDFYFDIAGIIIGLMLFMMMKNKKIWSLLTVMIIGLSANAQTIKESTLFQEELKAEFIHPEESPLDSLDRMHFEGLNFFPVSSAYIIEAQLIKQSSLEFFGMETTTSRRPEYRIYGIAHFELNGKKHSLTIYQNKKLMNTLDYGDYLFLPFTDLSNGESTYYGGRYVDLRITEGETILIDFNKSYNPYCAYSDRFSCPIVPQGNALEVSVEAGVKKYH